MGTSDPGNSTGSTMDDRLLSTGSGERARLTGDLDRSMLAGGGGGDGSVNGGADGERARLPVDRLVGRCGGGSSTPELRLGGDGRREGGASMSVVICGGSGGGTGGGAKGPVTTGSSRMGAGKATTTGTRGLDLPVGRIVN